MDYFLKSCFCNTCIIFLIIFSEILKNKNTIQACCKVQAHGWVFHCIFWQIHWPYFNVGGRLWPPHYFLPSLILRPSHGPVAALQIELYTNIRHIELGVLLGGINQDLYDMVLVSTDYGHTIDKYQSKICIYLGFGYKGLVFCRNNGCLMTQNLSAQHQKFLISMKKGFIGRPLSMLVSKRFCGIYS